MTGMWQGKVVCGWLIKEYTDDLHTQPECLVGELTVRSECLVGELVHHICMDDMSLSTSLR